MLSNHFFHLVTVAVVADLLGLPTIRAVIIAVYAALGIGLLCDAVSRPLDIALINFNDSLPGSVCQCIAPDIPRRLTTGTPAKAGDHGAGAVSPTAGGLYELGQLLPGLPELYGTLGGVAPGPCEQEQDVLSGHLNPFLWKKRWI